MTETINSSSQKIWIRIAFNSALGLILIFIWSRFVNIKEILQILSAVDLTWIIPIAFFVVLSGALRGYRLKLLLNRFHLPLKDAVMINYLSQFLSFLIPIRAGEITKSVYLSSQFSIGLGQSLIWVFIDRFLDFWIVLLLISLFVTSVPSSINQRTELLILILFLVLTVILIVAIYQGGFIKRLVNFASRIVVIKKVRVGLAQLTNSVIEGLELLKRSPRDLTMIAGLSLAATLSDCLVWWFTFLALGKILQLGITLMGDSLSALTFLIPSAPGYVGTTEAATLAVFSGVLGLPANLVSAGAVLFHGITIVALLTVGVLSLYFLKFDLRLVWNKIKRA